MDRHVIANMGAELGATSTVFPSDSAVRTFLKASGREEQFNEINADRELKKRIKQGSRDGRLRKGRFVE